MLKDKGCQGVGITEWRDWVSKFVADPQVKSGDLLLADQLAAHRDPVARQMLAKKGTFLYLNHSHSLL